jgi:hypothetical protein
MNKNLRNNRISKLTITVLTFGNSSAWLKLLRLHSQPPAQRSEALAYSRFQNNMRLWSQSAAAVNPNLGDITS